MKRLTRKAFIALSLLAGFSAHAADPLKTNIEKTALQYFIDHANPTTGLVRDNAENFKATPASNVMASMAATGFGFTVLANAAKRGLMPKDQAEAMILKALKFSRDHVGRHKGWFYHFIDWTNGQRILQSEYSTIDTALFIAGALYAARIFPDGELARIAQQLYLDVDYVDFMTDGGAKPQKKTLSMAFVDGEGYSNAQWNMYGEQMVMLLLGLGHPTHPLPVDAWLAWDRHGERAPKNEPLMGLEEALFVHQYSQLYVDFRQVHDAYPNYFENSVKITARHRSFMQGSHYKTLQEGFWGFSAGEALNDGYEVWTGLYNKGIVCIGCTVASAMFDPTTVLSDVAKWVNGPYQKEIWGRYGLTDSIDVGQKWYSHRVLGITVGPEFLSLANITPETSVWQDFMQIPAIQAGVRAANSTARTY